MLDKNILDAYLFYGNRVIASHVARHRREDIQITIITVEEEMRSALATVHRRRDTPLAVTSYQTLIALWNDLHQFDVLPYDQAAADCYRLIRPGTKRLRTQDCRLAAIAISRNLTFVTADHDFLEIDGANVVDWTIDPNTMEQ